VEEDASSLTKVTRAASVQTHRPIEKEDEDDHRRSRKNGGARPKNDEGSADDGSGGGLFHVDEEGQMAKRRNARTVPINV
jgi:hypothetical protein